MPTITELKQRIDLHDLAKKLNLVRPDSRGNYKSPHHDDKSPSLSIFTKNGEQGWKDFSADTGGSCVDLVMHVEGLTEVRDAVVRLHEIYELPLDEKQREMKKQGIELYAENYKASGADVIPYLEKERGIDRDIVEACIKRGSLGYCDYTSPKFKPGDRFYGGPAAAFIVRDMNTGFVKAIDYRYIDPALNGDLKTKSQGEKQGFPWYPDGYRLESARVVVLVESAINALTVETCKLPGTTSVATRGTAVTNVDWRFLRGKLVVVCMDNDPAIKEGPRKGERPGSKAAWSLHEQLSALDIACIFIDQYNEDWLDVNDLNDYIKKHGKENTRIALKRYEDFLIPGLPCGSEEGQLLIGKPRVFLPAHDYTKYWMFRVKTDHSTVLKKITANDEAQIVIEDLCGFRIVAMTRIRIASANAAMSGDKDLSPTTLFCASVQTPRHGNRLLRKVFPDDKLYNPDQWREFGAIYNTTKFSRMLNLLERTTHLGERDAVNFVGLVWKNGSLVVNEGADTYFTEPDKQCPYANLCFPSGPSFNAKKVLVAYQETFSDNAASQTLVWALGAHMKAFLGFWPHMNMQADKGSGKSTLINRLERTIGFNMFGAQSLQTEFRLLTTMSHTSHPVGWEEISTRRQDVIDKAVAMLQESYQFTITRRGSDMVEYLMCAPVLLAGEDVPVDGLTGKLCRVELRTKGAIMPENLPVFPVLQWLQYLAELKKETVIAKYQEVLKYCEGHCSADRSTDHGAQRMITNYAAMLTAWRFVCDFSGLSVESGSFVGDLIKQMNGHINDTKAKREPWVWIMEIILSEIDANRFPYAFKFERDAVSNEYFLLVRCTHLMQHIATSSHLRDKFNSLTIKSAGVFKKQLLRAGVIVAEGKERTIDRVRIAHLQVMSLTVLEQYGLTVAMPDTVDSCAEPAWAQNELKLAV